MPRYTALHTDDALESLELCDHETRARVRIAPGRGGMVTRFDVGDERVLFLDDASLRDPSKSVRGGVPLLFPIAGKLADDRYLVGEKPYTMKQHGFARSLPWAERELHSDPQCARVTLELTPTELTRAQYPFEWLFRASYTLSEGALELALTVENHGDVPMPVQPGTHPYFYLPDGEKKLARLETAATQAFDNVTHQEVPVQLPVNFAVAELDLHLLDHDAPGTTLTRPGLAPVKLAWSANHTALVLWTLAGRDFVCVEPWSARGGALARGDAPTVPPRGKSVWTLSLRAGTP